MANLEVNTVPNDGVVRTVGSIIPNCCFFLSLAEALQVDALTLLKESEYQDRGSVVDCTKPSHFVAAKLLVDKYKLDLIVYQGKMLQKSIWRISRLDFYSRITAQTKGKTPELQRVFLMTNGDHIELIVEPLPQAVVSRQEFESSESDLLWDSDEESHSPIFTGSSQSSPSEVKAYLPTSTAKTVRGTLISRKSSHTAPIKPVARSWRSPFPVYLPDQ